MAGYKEKARATFLEKVHAKGLCDERDVAFCASADALPDGSFGIVLLALDGNRLHICDTDMQSNIGATLCTVPMAEVSDFKIGRSLVGNTLRFTAGNFVYSFRNMVGLKELLDIIGSEVGK